MVEAAGKRGAVLPVCAELGIGLVPYSPLGRGFLTEAIDEHTTFDSADNRNELPRFTVQARKANQALVDRLRTIGERKRATSAQLALAWILAHAPWIAPIPGTTKVHRLEENLRATTLELTSSDRAEIDRAASEVTIVGDRYHYRIVTLARFQGGPEGAAVRVREVSLALRCGGHQRLHLLGEVVEGRPERGAERGGEPTLGKVRPVPLHDRR